MIISTQDFADMMGIEFTQAKTIIRAKNIKNVVLGRTMVLDEEDVRRFMNETLAEQIEHFDRSAQQKRESLVRMQKFFEEANDPDRIEDFVTVKQACEQYKLAPEQIRSMISHDKVKCRMVGHAWLINKQSLDEAVKQVKDN